MGPVKKEKRAGRREEGGFGRGDSGMGGRDERQERWGRKGEGTPTWTLM